MCTAENLRQASCKPCEGGIPTLSRAEAESLLQAIPDWSLSEDATLISRKINCGNFAKAIALMGRIAEVAESEQHHPDLHLTGYRHLRVDLTTHAIGGLSENDFIVAAKIDPLI
tara:strand:+ start:1051018 stop:1051359 length:342 start_codon:yes stop_codon:yes gene_type:complete